MEDGGNRTQCSLWDGTHFTSFLLPYIFISFLRKVLTTFAIWNHVGDAIFASTTDGAVRILSYPDMDIQGRANAHVRALYALALDPRGKHVFITILSIHNTTDPILCSEFSDISQPVDPTLS